VSALRDEVVVKFAKGARVTRMAQTQFGEHIDGVLRRIKTLRQRNALLEQIVAINAQIVPHTSTRHLSFPNARHFRLFNVQGLCGCDLLRGS